MKKSKIIFLGAVFLAGLSACKQKNSDWEPGYDTVSPRRDTTFHGYRYRYHRGGWYPVYNNLICPSYYNRGYNYSEISHPNFIPAHAETGSLGNISGVAKGGGARGIRTGGFGLFGHSFGGGGRG